MQSQIHSSEYSHEEVFERVIEAHQRVAERWNEERKLDRRDLDGITELHTDDALYRPFRCTCDLEREFYAEVDAVMDGARWVEPTIPDE